MQNMSNWHGPCPHLMPFVLVSIIDIAHSLRFHPSLNHHSWARMAASLEGSELSGWSRPASVVKLRNASCLLDFQALRGERRWIGFSGRGAFCLKQEMGVEALGRRHDWVRIQIVLGIAEWENGGPEFGVGPATSGHPWKCLWGLLYSSPTPPPASFPLVLLFLPLSLDAFSWEEPGWKQRGPKQKRRAFVLLHTLCESCLCQSVFLVNPCVQLRIYVEMFVCSLSDCLHGN